MARRALIVDLPDRPPAFLSVWRAWVGLTIGVLIATAANAPGSEGQEAGKQFGTRADLVVVDVAVVDQDGRAVAGLTPDDFRLVEDGKPQTVTYFDAIVAPATTLGPTSELGPAVTAQATRVARTFALLFDDLHLLEHEAQVAGSIFAGIVRESLGSGDSVALVAPGAGLAQVFMMPNGGRALLAQLAALRGLAIRGGCVSEYEAFEIHAKRNQIVAQEVWERLRSNTSVKCSTPWDEAALAHGEFSQRVKATIGVLHRTLEHMTQLQGRKSVIVASHGFILDSESAGFRDVIRASLRASAPVHLIDMRRRQPLRARQQLEQQTAKDLGDPGSWQVSSLAFAEPAASEGTNMLAVDTGGVRIPAGDGSTKELRLIGELARTYYLLGYESTHLQRDGKFRRVTVEMTRKLKGIRVLSRRGYFAPVE